MPAINATIFLAYKANECNKSLTSFLLREKKSFKHGINLTVFLVKNVQNIDKKITKLPTMEWVVNGKKQFIVGNSAIIGTIEKNIKKPDKDSVDAFWNDIMLSGGDDVSPEEEFTRNIPSLVENISQQRMKKGEQDSTESEQPQQPESKGSISSFEDDPVMKRFYENMETSPGESQYENTNHDFS